MTQVVQDHRAVYRDLHFEYPPVAWWVMAMPYFFSDGTTRNLAGHFQGSEALYNYTNLFRGFMLICNIAAFVFFVLLVRRRKPGSEGRAALLYVFCTILLGHVLFDRLDSCLLLLLVLGSYLWVLSSEPKQKGAFDFESYRFWAYVTSIGLGIGFKIIPMLAVPFLVIAESQQKHAMRRLRFAFFGLFIGAGVPFLIQYMVSGPDVFAVFSHHAKRGIQLESLYSTWMTIAAWFGYPVSIAYIANAYNIDSQLGPIMAVLSKTVLFVFLASFYVWALVRRPYFQDGDALSAGCLAIAAAVILSPVLSPQYFVWSLPLVIALEAEILAGRGVEAWISGLALVAIAGMTVWIFPYHYFTTNPDSCGLVAVNVKGLVSARPLAYVVLALRNLTYLAVVLWLGIRYFTLRAKPALSFRDKI